ncbi:hypothetical protein WA158_001171 [Blastocystis sp. Blastoise]
MDFLEDIPLPVVGVTLICFYFMFSPFRSIVIDILSALVCIYYTYCYYQLKETKEGNLSPEESVDNNSKSEEQEPEVHSEEEKEEEYNPIVEEPEHSDKIHYSLEEMRAVATQTNSVPESDGREFKIVRNEVPISSPVPEKEHPTPRPVEETPEPREYAFRKRTPAPGLLGSALRSHSPEPDHFYLRETPDIYEGDVTALPNEPLSGKIQLLNKTNGRIRLPYKINMLRDVFFHFKDLEIDADDHLEVGDTVQYQLSIYQNKLCAIHVKRGMIRPLSVPDMCGDMKKKSQLSRYLQPDDNEELEKDWRK